MMATAASRQPARAERSFLLPLLFALSTQDIEVWPRSCHSLFRVHGRVRGRGRKLLEASALRAGIPKDLIHLALMTSALVHPDCHVVTTSFFLTSACRSIVFRLR